MCRRLGKLVGGLWLAAGSAIAADAPEGYPADADLLTAYGSADLVSIATGRQQPRRQAPAVASVVTRADIRALGARSLSEALVGVAGLHVSRSPLNYNPIFTFRGIHTQYNPQVLLLQNGVPLTSVFVGDRGNFWGSMSVDNVERIEIIRGPGSALYGADAFAGVINVITRSPDDYLGSEAGVRFGSFATRDLWASHSGEAGPLRFAIHASTLRTNGHDEPVAFDAQSQVDAALGTSASLAPGGVSLGAKGSDFALDLLAGRWQFRMTMKERHGVGTGVGVASALDPEGQGDNRTWTAALDWRADDLVQDWAFEARADALHMSDRSFLHLFPDGAVGGAFPDGVIGSPRKWERHMGLSTSGLYSGWKDHLLRVGAGAGKLDLYKVEEVKNFVLSFIPGVGVVPLPLAGGLTDVTDTAPFIRPQERRFSYAYVQDEWNLARDLTLTAGLRHDRYSDFGHTTNPRLALVWDAGEGAIWKLLYGRAFRAPSFAERYNINNPVALGNPTVSAEKIETLEAAVNWKARRDLDLATNIYAYRIRDTLRQEANPDPTTGATAQNGASIDGHGVEFEFTWKAATTVTVNGHYALHLARDRETGEDPGGAPRQRAYLQLDWRAPHGIRVRPRVYWVADRERQTARTGETPDLRDPVDDYVLADVTVMAENVAPGLDLSLSLLNLADAVAYEPSPLPGVVDDLPLARRTWLLSGTYRF
ncbi:MAG: TonB-dependent receptor [Rhodocyclaceae bacterium]|nr:TonB-dependent receptor [Rhodocyclaceae bacterium]